MNFDLTNILAVYGSFLATVGFVWQVFKYVRDKAHLKIEVNHHLLVGRSEAQHKLGISAINIGTRSIFIVAAGFTFDPPLLKGSKATVFDPDLPRDLKAGHKHVSFVDPSEIPPDQVLCAWIRDATGQNWKSKKWPLKLSK